MSETGFKYDVFISYKHDEFDSRIAQAVHRKLEHYRIPKEIQKKTGKKRIQRVFRDQDELSIGQDLGAEIEEQLKQSEFLVVICSPRSRESVWVSREITTFRKYHDDKHILPLLIEGEPETAFPEELLNAGEPFAADVRAADVKGALKKLKREILRIAAPVLHCSYDELRQRQKHYQMQRTAAIALSALALSVAIMAVLFSQYIKTKAAYRSQSISEAHLLVQEAQRQLEAGDRIGAIETLLRALPSEENDLPLIPEAQYALTEALGIYEMGQSDVSMISEGCFTLTSDMNSCFALDGAGDHLLVCTNQAFYVFDTVHYTLQSRIPLSPSGTAIYPDYMIGEHKALLKSYNTLELYDLEADRAIWQINTADRYEDILVDRERDRLLLLEKQGLKIIELETGAVLGKRQLEEINLSYTSAAHRNLCLSDDGRYAAYLQWYEEQKFDFRYSVSVLDTETGECRNQTCASDAAFCFDEEDRLLVMNVEEGELVVSCMETPGESPDWIFRYPSESSRFLNLCPVKSAEDREWMLMAVNGNRTFLLNRDGACLWSNEHDISLGSIISIYSEGSTYCQITEDGYLLQYQIENDSIKAREEHLMQGKFQTLLCSPQGTWFGMVDANTIAHYVPAERGIGYTAKGELPEELRVGSLHDYAYTQNENHIIYLSARKELIDLNTDNGASAVYDADLETDYSRHRFLEKLEADRLTVFERNGGNDADCTASENLLTFDLASGSREEEELYRETADSASIRAFGYRNGVLVNVESNGIIHYGDESFTLDLRDGYINDAVLSPDGTKLAVMDTSDLYFYLVDLKNSRVVIKMDLSGWKQEYLSHIYGHVEDYLAWDADGTRFALAGNEAVYICSADGKTVTVVSNRYGAGENEYERALFLNENALYLINGDELLQYDGTSGTLLNSCKISQIKAGGVTFEDQGEQLYLFNRYDQTAYILCKDRELFGITARIPQVIGLYPETASAYVAETDYLGSAWGEIPLYTLQEIVDMAQELLHTHMTQEIGDESEYAAAEDSEQGADTLLVDSTTGEQGQEIKVVLEPLELASAEDREHDLAVLQERAAYLKEEYACSVREEEGELVLRINDRVRKSLEIGQFLELYLTEPAWPMVFGVQDDALQSLENVDTRILPEDILEFEFGKDPVEGITTEKQEYTIRLTLSDRAADLINRTFDRYGNVVLTHTGLPETYGDTHSPAQQGRVLLRADGGPENVFYIAYTETARTAGMEDLLRHNWTTEDLIYPYEYYETGELIWEDPLVCEAGEHQISAAEVGGEYREIMYYTYGRMTQERAAMTEGVLKSRLDKLDIPYAFGRNHDGDLVVRTHSERFTEKIAAILRSSTGFSIGSRDLGERTCYPEVVEFQNDNGQIRIELSKYWMEELTEQLQTLEATEENPAVFDLSAGGVVIASAQITEASKELTFVCTDPAWTDGRGKVEEWFLAFLQEYHNTEIERLLYKKYWRYCR